MSRASILPVARPAISIEIKVPIPRGAVSTIAEARRIIEHSFPTERFEPIAADRWSAHYRRFLDYVELTCV